MVSGGGSPPSVHAEETLKKTGGETSVDTLDSSNSLIDLQEDDGNRGEMPKSPEKSSGSTAAGKGGQDQPSILPGETELKFYYRSYAPERALDCHLSPWNVMQGDDVLNDPSACREILGGLGTPFETARVRGLPRENRINQLSSMLVGSSIIANAIMEEDNVLARREEETIRLQAEAEAMVKAAREGAEQLEKDKAAFEKLKQTEMWATSAGLKQELNNLKAVNAALVKEKVAAEAAVKEAEARGAKVLEEVDADRDRLNKAVEELKVEVQNRVTIIEEVSARATEAEARPREAEEAKDGFATSLSQVTVDHLWMREHGIGHVSTWCLFHPYVCLY
ncbi:hypothetical protein HanIR_Chr04g0161871 [Helianthus annuus]|nr:hypothetical protein HanIR_Chr04g0161871 [Helianthus annuus]